MLEELVRKNRSYRRFYEDIPVDRETLRGLVDLARTTPSATNRQPLRYVLSWTKERNDLIFPTLAWASYLPDWGGPAPGERPAAYIVMLADRRISTTCAMDAGIAAQTIMLGATERGLGGCIMMSVNRPRLTESLHIPADYDIVLMLALGKPKETVVIEDVPPSGDIRYWRDAQGVHHVPKRSLDELILEFGQTAP